MHEPRLNRALRELLIAQRVASLGTLNDEGGPFVSMAPFAVEPGAACLVIHVSLLAPHTRNMLANPAMSLMVLRPEVAGEPVLALPRVSMECTAARLQTDSPDWVAARQAYLARFPEAEPMTQLGDFSFVALYPRTARQVAGFGSARSLEAGELAGILRLMST